MTSRWRGQGIRHSRTLARRGLRHAVPGFTLIELVVAMAILLVVMIGVLSAISFAYTSSTDTEMRNTAKNVASYSLEYLRARTVTRGTAGMIATLGITPTSTGTYGWYDATTNPTGAFPSMIDLEKLPIQSDGWPCNFLAGTVNGNSVNQGSGGGIGAGGIAFQFSSMHPALPTETFSTTPLAWTTTLQGYVSVRNRLPTNDVTGLTATQNPAPEDANFARMHDTTTGYADGRYRTTLTSQWAPLVVQFPGVYPLTAGSLYVASFTPLTGYLAKVYTTDAAKTVSTKAQYNPYYTNLTTDKAATQAYRGFRVLTTIVARVPTPVPPALRLTTVQYYDVTVTVLWMNGTRESNYELVSQIVAY